MPNSVKPCIRCKGTGRVPIEVINPDRRDHTIIGMAKCHGCGGTGKVPVGEPCELEQILEKEAQG